MSFSSVYINKYSNIEKDIKVYTNEELISVIGKEIDRLGYDCSLNHIDVSEVTDFSNVFINFRDFKGDISSWDVSNGISFKSMFSFSKFNGNILKWNMKSAKNLNSMFSNSEFNNDISTWDVSNAVTMDSMFHASKFNQDISLWDVSNVCSMKYMFSGCMFTQNISNWDVHKCIVTSMFFNNKSIVTDWYLRQNDMYEKHIKEMKTINWNNDYHTFTEDELKLLDTGKHTLYIDCENGRVLGHNDETKQSVNKLYSFTIQKDFTNKDYAVLYKKIKDVEFVLLSKSYSSVISNMYGYGFKMALGHGYESKKGNLYLLKTVNYHANLCGFPYIKKIDGRVSYSKSL